MTVPWVPSDETLEFLISNGVNTAPEIVDYLHPGLNGWDRYMYRNKVATKLMRLRRRGIVRRCGRRDLSNGRHGVTIWEWCA